MTSKTVFASNTVFGLIAVCGLGVSLMANAPARAEQGTEQQREACTPDVFRLCGRYIPDEDRIATCLRNSGPRLSPACYAVFYPPQATPPQAAGQPANPQTTTGQANNPRAIRPQAPVTSTVPPPPTDNDDD